MKVLHTWLLLDLSRAVSVNADDSWLQIASHHPAVTPRSPCVLYHLQQDPSVIVAKPILRLGQALDVS